MSLHVSVIDPYEENTLNSQVEYNESPKNNIEDESEQDEEGSKNSSLITIIFHAIF